ncbi:MAG: hypothetical protein COV47_03140 [Candidatus Diapherotrites archaeon CG11_big_fil_rev_8_21_14_0_20_37_9]|nr:MAG: hypothetical protein COV47_03140 [Candidatus Diapherotrites archaeon CG11_big_fil_rev_8_21_14_0_20_37_9]
MLKMSLFNLFRHKLRTILSVLGIVIGVASLIVLVSLVDGFRGDIESAFSSAQGVRVVPVNATNPVFGSMDDSWINKISQVNGVKTVIPTVMRIPRSIDGESPLNAQGTRVVGQDLQKVAQASNNGFDGELLSGRTFNADDRGVALIGKQIQDDYDKFVGSKIKINGKSLRVIGVYTTGSDFLDGSILTSIEDLRELSDFPDNKVSFLVVEVVNLSDDSKVVKMINLLYGDDIKASTVNDFSAQFSVILDSITLLVVVIASIASFVAAISIINTMLMSVLERFKEIGALKAVGWTNDDIVKMVLYESGLIGVIGGLFGVILGVLASNSLIIFGLETRVTLPLVLGSFFGAVFVGILAGVYPAINASRLDPIDALRSE